MKILIVEDEESAAQQLASQVRELMAAPEITGIIDSVEDAIRFLLPAPPVDLVFLDIYLSDGLSFDIFNTIKPAIPIIFTTAYDQYAVRAFEVNSIDYLLKPIRKENLQKALDKYEWLYQNRRQTVIDEQMLRHINQMISVQNSYKRHFLVPYKDRLIPVAADEFAWFEIRNGVVRGITFNKNHWLMEETLEQLADHLNPAAFYRANRQFLISRKAIKEVEHYFNGRFCLHLTPDAGEPVLISKAKAGDFKEWMTQ